MPSKVYNNVEGHRVIDNGRIAEDVTSVSLPTIEHTWQPLLVMISRGTCTDGNATILLSRFVGIAPCF